VNESRRRDQCVLDRIIRAAVVHQLRPPAKDHAIGCQDVMSGRNRIDLILDRFRLRRVVLPRYLDPRLQLPERNCGEKEMLGWRS
jgi:hypothetical protein